jgi:rSAM/selenodomain-associated transferase 2
MLSVIVPTLNAAPGLEASLRAAALPPVSEVIVVDGGSEDATLAIARSCGARVLSASRSRGAQMAAGASAARNQWFLFLHSDTVLPSGWGAAAATFMAEPKNARRAAVFGFRLDDASEEARRLERQVAWRVKHFGLAYGDQGLLLAKDFYLALGGFRPLPIMEDVDLVRRIGKTRIAVLPAFAVTSAAKWRAQGWRTRSARNLFCLALFFLGVPPERIARFYDRTPHDRTP